MNNNVIINELNAHLLEVQTRALEYSDWMIANKDSKKEEIVCCKDMYHRAYGKMQEMRKELEELKKSYYNFSEDLEQLRKYAFYYEK